MLLRVLDLETSASSRPPPASSNSAGATCWRSTVPGSSTFPRTSWCILGIDTSP